MHEFAIPSCSGNECVIDIGNAYGAGAIVSASRRDACDALLSNVRVRFGVSIAEKDGSPQLRLLCGVEI